jgi:large subunit ribosomal protein L4
MSTTDVYNLQKEKVAEIELRNDVFDVPIKQHILHQVVVSQLLKRRSGSASTKGRSEIRGSGSKLWRQKGTGRARVGAASSPIRRGGGVAFGPSPRSYARIVPKKVRKAALRMALSDKLQNGMMVVLNDFSLPEIKTKAFMEIMASFGAEKALVVTESKNVNLEKSSRNIPNIKVLRYEGLNVYDVLKHDHLFFVQPAVEKIQEVLVP